MTTMTEWLTRALRNGKPLSEATEGYLLGRGLLESRIKALGIVEWASPEEACPDPTFVSRYGLTGSGDHPEGQRVADLRKFFIVPFYSPRGEVLGFEGRLLSGKKQITDFRLPASKWNPVFLGLTPGDMQKLWHGGDLWVTEGLFDAGPLERVIPQTDVAVGTVRAKLSDRHVEFCRRYVRGMVHMVYDNDETGRKQTHGWTDATTGRPRWGALDRLGRVGVRARDVPYKGGKDPGEVWDHGGLEALQSAFQYAIL